LFVMSDIYAWRAIDEQSVCAAQTGKLAEAFMLNRRLLASPDLPDTQRERIAVNRDFSVPTMLEAASSYPDALIANLTPGPPDAEITVTLIAGPDHTTTEHTLNSFLNCCTDLTRIGRYLIADTGLPPTKRAALQQRYPFLEFVECADGAELRTHINGRFWLHLDQGWRFFAPDNLITRLTAILTTETQVVQVGINLADATTLTSTSANEHTVHRTPDTGRYVLTNAIANGPAMVDTTRPRHTTPPHTATLDEILCIADLLDGREGGNA
jgi:hypothetical protein